MAKAKFPKLPEVDVSFVQFAVCAMLAEGPQSMQSIRDILTKQMAWAAGRNAASVVLRNFERTGVVASETSDNGERIFRLTKSGLQRIRDAASFYDVALHRWKRAIRHVRPARLPDSSALKTAETQRPPNEDEFEQVMGVASEAFRRIYRFSRVSGVRAHDLATAQVEGFNPRKSTLMLESTSLTRRTIPESERTVQLTAETKDLLKDAIGGRRTGPIFVKKNGKRWGMTELTMNFQHARLQAGLPDEIVMSGRGGSVGKRFRQSVESQP